MALIKICGITNPDDARAAVEAGADALGFVLEPTSPRYVGPTGTAICLLDAVPPDALRVAVFGHLSDIDRFNVELVDWFDVCQYVSKSDGELKGVRCWQVVRLRDAASVREAANLATELDALLADTYHPTLAGGTGETCDWMLASELRRQTETPLIVAGGLTPENVADAISAVRPSGVDVSTGVECAPRRKDHAKMRAFVANARRAAAELE